MLLLVASLLFLMAAPVIIVLRTLFGPAGPREADRLRAEDARLAERLESQAARMERRMENVEEIVDIRKE